MSKEIKKPNFFIVGGPKCGTTSMSEYLRSHPDVFFSNPKEPHFFNTDFSDRQRKYHSEKEYLKLFKQAKGYDAVGEGSVYYLSSKEAISNIIKFNPAAKFIVMLRNPLKMFTSLFHQYRYSLVEDQTSLYDAWMLQDSRSKGENIPPGCADPKLLQYKNICSIGNQPENLYERTLAENIHTIFMDDIKKDPEKVCVNICKFLEINQDNGNFPTKNERKKNKSDVIKYFLRKLSLIKSTLCVKMNLGLHSRIKNINTEKVYNKDTINQDLKAELLIAFEDDINKLSLLTNRDLSNWFK